MNKDVEESRLRISRRRALSLGGWCAGTPRDSGDSSSAGAAPSSTASWTSSASPEIIALLNKAHACTMAREETEGPHWFDVDSIRTEIHEDRPGTPLRLHAW